MQKQNNSPFLFAVLVWVGTWLFSPLLYLGMRMVPGLEETSDRNAATPPIPFLINVYPVSLGVGFLLFGIFSFLSDFLAKSKMPVWLVKAILSVLAFLLVRVGFFLIGAQLEDWLGLFRSYYLSLFFIWSIPLKRSQSNAVDAPVIGS